MKHEDYYKISQERIGQYDAYGFRCKQWLVPLISAIVYMAFKQKHMAGWLIALGILGIGLLFLVQMAYQVVASRFIIYSGDLEDEILRNPDTEVSRPELALTNVISVGTRQDWREFWDLAWKVFFRVRGGLPYLVAMLFLVGGVLIACFS